MSLPSVSGAGLEHENTPIGVIFRLNRAGGELGEAIPFSAPNNAGWCRGNIPVLSAGAAGSIPAPASRPKGKFLRKVEF